MLLSHRFAAKKVIGLHNLVDHLLVGLDSLTVHLDENRAIGIQVEEFHKARLPLVHDRLPMNQYQSRHFSLSDDRARHHGLSDTRRSNEDTREMYTHFIEFWLGN